MVGNLSYPILYNSTETNFDNNGLGILGDCISCEVTEEANGIFELSMKYPMDGIHFEDIERRSIIKSKADQFRKPQLFRVYAISKPMSGIVTVLAEHISYDLSGIPVSPFTAYSVAEAIVGLKNNAVIDCPFTFYTDKSTGGKFSVNTPASIRSRLGGVEGSILDTYGGEFEFDNYAVNLYNNRGANRGVSIRYGKNLTNIVQDENCSSVATGVYPYWAGEIEGKTVLVELPNKIINAPGTYNFVKIRTLDLSGEFETQPTVEQLQEKAERYINANDIGVPNVAMTISFAQLEQIEEYKGLKLLESVGLFDTVNVEFPALKVSATAKAVRLVYDVIADKVKSVTLGAVKSNIADTIAEQKQEIQKKPSKSIIDNITSALTKAITGANGGCVRILDTDDDGMPDELYIADNDDPDQAVKVWRFNYEGWAGSKTGYNGPFTMGATLDDGLLASFVTAANLVAGTIQSADGETFFLDLDNGILKIKAIGEVEQKVSDIEDDIKDMTLKIEGIDGTNFYIKYSQYEDGHAMTDVPDDSTQYIGTCITNQSTAPTDYKAYTWCRIKGQDGTNGAPGTPGANGKTQYLHIKYSDDGKTFTANDGEELGAYIGTLVDFTEADSLNFNDYTWKKFTEDVDEELNEIRQTITEQYTQIINDSEKVVMNALKSYVQTSDYETFKKTTESELKLLSDKLTLKFTEAVEQIEEINGDLQTKINTIVKYFTFDINGLTIGQEDNPNKVVIDNDEISILVNGTVVQKFDSSGRALTPELTVTKALNLLGYLIDMDEEGNVNCGYVGMEEG